MCAASVRYEPVGRFERQTSDQNRMQNGPKPVSGFDFGHISAWGTLMWSRSAAKSRLCALYAGRFGSESGHSTHRPGAVPRADRQPTPREPRSQVATQPSRAGPPKRGPLSTRAVLQGASTVKPNPTPSEQRHLPVRDRRRQALGAVVAGVVDCRPHRAQGRLRGTQPVTGSRSAVAGGVAASSHAASASRRRGSPASGHAVARSPSSPPSSGSCTCAACVPSARIPDRPQPGEREQRAGRRRGDVERLLGSGRLRAPFVEAVGDDQAAKALERAAGTPDARATVSTRALIIFSPRVRALGPGWHEPPAQQLAARRALAVGRDRQHLVARARRCTAGGPRPTRRSGSARGPRPGPASRACSGRTRPAGGRSAGARGDLLGALGLRPFLAPASEVRQHRRSRPRTSTMRVEDRRCPARCRRTAVRSGSRSRTPTARTADDQHDRPAGSRGSGRGSRRWPAERSGP